MVDISVILDLIKSTEGLLKETDLAEILGVESNVVHNWRKRGTVPMKNLHNYCTKRNYDLEVLIKEGRLQPLTKSVAENEKGGDKGGPDNDPFDEIHGRLQNIREALSGVQCDKTPAVVPGIIKSLDELETFFQDLRFPIDKSSNVFTFIPLYNAGTGAENDALLKSKKMAGHFAFKTSWLTEELGVRPDSLALLSAGGDSMEPTLHSGDLLLVDLATSLVEEDAIYAIQNDGGLAVKRIQKMFDGSVLIKSDNPLYKEQILGKDNMEALRIIGRVVWAGRKL